ncbi:FtsX-like permease family protein [Engelhardtia mirabilis]|uniref:FtsX-like permease family protein n=1 Tax=Engelhardtia mirabilis TaxID=2528011 RepID=A0A518BDZ9_9BACT|nr:FtsX-like permease family protein [Planctomycetes bacterium Pla133]QDU99527.1 FtsX-like permease family protein [Planctomycetes bacterium Pla86]
MKALRALRALARVELRDLGRHRGRSLLVILLVAVPVAALTGAGALVRTMSPTLEEQRAARFGSADLRVEYGSPEQAAAMRASLGPGARTTTLGYGVLAAGQRGAKVDALAVEADLNDGDLGLLTGLLRITAGRAPAAPDELALSPNVATALGVAPGDSVDIDGHRGRVSGLVVSPERLGDPIVLRPLQSGRGGAGTLLAAAPAAELDRAVRGLTELGARPELRGELDPADGFEAAVLFVVGGLGFVEAALVVAAAFAVGLRRRQRELGLLAASGAPGRLLGPGLLAAPLVLALLGSAAGVAVGLAAAWLAHPLLDGWNQRLNGPFEVSLAHLLGGVALGLVAASLAALLPIWTALRVPVRTALSGRRPPAGRARGWLALGLALVVSGVLVLAIGLRLEGAINVVAILAGSVLGVLGLGSASPWLLEALSRRATRLTPAWRLAVRDAGRFRARNAPVVTAVLAGLSASLLLAALSSSVEAFVGQVVPTLRADQLLVEGPGAGRVAAELAAELNGEAAALQAVVSGGQPVMARPSGDGGGAGTWLAVGDADLLRAMAIEVADFAASGVVWLRRPAGAVDHLPAELELLGGVEVIARLPTRTLDEAQPSRTPLALLPVAMVEQLGLEVGAAQRGRPAPWIVRARGPVDAARFERARQLAAQVPGTTVDAELLRTNPTLSTLAIALALSMATGLLVIFIATALSAVESADDARTLQAVGAPPALLHGTQAARAAYLALLGSALAIPGGLLPGFGLVELAEVPLEFALPWRVMAIVLIGMPTLAWLGAWSASRVRPLFTDRRPLVAAE